MVQLLVPPPRHSSSRPTIRHHAGQPSQWWLAPAVMGLIVSLAACGSPPTSSPTVVPTATMPAEDATASACASSPPGVTSWITLRSQSTGDILAAVRQSAVFQMVTCAPPESDGYFDLSRLGAPVLVRGFGVNKAGG